MNQDFAPGTFVAESRELLRDMETALLILERSPNDTEAINAVFRAMHTIKGSSGVFGFDVIVEFTHVMESLIEEVRAGRVSVDDNLVALLLDCGDHVTSLIDCLEGDDRIARLETARAAGAGLLAQLHCFEPGIDDAVSATDDCGLSLASQPACDAASAVANPAWHVSARFGRGLLHHGMDPLSFIRYLSTLGEIVSLDTVFDAMPAADAMDPQACYIGVEIQFAGSVDRQAIEGAFEYVRDDSTIRILQPHAPLSEYADLIDELGEETAGLGELLVRSGALTRDELEMAIDLRNSRTAPVDASAPDPAGPGRAGEADGGAGLSAAQTPGRQPGSTDTRTLRVQAAKLDELINLVGELVIANAGVNTIARRSADAELTERTATMERLVEQVRDGALKLRMVPIGETFSRFQRVVHDLGRDLGKDVELVLTGTETELDKSMVEKLSDPLMHLVRNALDHGIEPAAVRAQRGKPGRGRLQLNAYHDAGSIVIEIADDGGGLDRDKILGRAIERGLATPGQALDDREIYRLVMEPGFSTTDEVTSVSGRGVGMDVVRRNVDSLRGSISIDSVAGEGATIAIRLPLTLAIIDGFVVAVGSAAYVMPLDMVIECMELSGEERAKIRDSGYINLRGEVLPLLRLRDVFEVTGDAGKRENIVVVQYGGQQAGFVVDALLGEFQTVIKPLGKLFEQLSGFSGSTILGTGEVALILDVQALVQRAAAVETGRISSAGEHRPLAKQ